MDAILSGTATLCFSGMVQLKEHSSSRLHLEAVAFFQRAQEKEPCCGRKEEARLAGKEQKRISEYFQQSSVNLNEEGPPSSNTKHTPEIKSSAVIYGIRRSLKILEVVHRLEEQLLQASPKKDATMAG